MLFSEGCYLDTFFSGLRTNAPYYQELPDSQQITLHKFYSSAISGTCLQKLHTAASHTAQYCVCLHAYDIPYGPLS